MIRINLLKPEKKELKETPAIPIPEAKVQKKIPAFSLILLLLIIAVFALFLFQKRVINKEKNLLREAQEEKKQLQDVLVKLDKLEEQKRIFEKKIDLINQLKSFQEVAVKIMDELSKNIPEWVWLTETTYNNQAVKIKGNALSNNLIADYIFNLENSPYFSNVNLISSTQKRTKNNQYLEFSLTTQYVLPEVISATSGESGQKQRK